MVTDTGRYVARLWSDGGDLLGIDREHEYRNSQLAAAAGVGAPVIEYRPQDRVLVLGFIEGRTLGDADVADPAMIERIAAACRALHAAGRFAGDFDMFALQPRYYATVQQAGIRIPAGYAGPAARLRGRAGGARGPGRGHGAVQQRPAGRQLHRRRQPPLADRLRVLR